MKKISPTPWKRDEYGSIRDATGERISLTGCALATGRVRPDDECHGNTAMLFAAPALEAALRRLIACYAVSHSPADRMDAWTEARTALAMLER